MSVLSIADEGIISKRDDLSGFFPGITVLDEHELIASQHVGSSCSHPDNDLEILRSHDGGKTWDSEGLIHGGKQHEGWAYRAPQITRLGSGQLVMVAERCRDEGFGSFDLDSGTLQDSELILYQSRDKGLTWSGPDRIDFELPVKGCAAVPCAKLIEINPDRWMVSLETYKAAGFEGGVYQRAAMIFSDDGGKSWKDFTTVATDPNHKRYYWDQMCARLPDGRILTYLWTHIVGENKWLNNHWTLSEDDGLTWSPPVETNVHGQVCYPIPLQDGSVAAIYNQRTHPHGIRVALARNDFSDFDIENEVEVFSALEDMPEGEVSENFLEEHCRINFGRPAGFQLPDGDLMTYFWCTTDDITHTRWVKLTLS